MILNLSKNIDRERFKRRCNDLYIKQAVVVLTEKKQRTLSQNNYLHLLLTWFALETGCTVEDVKREYFKRHCNPDIFETQPGKFAGAVPGLKSSADVTSAEMTTAIERFRNWSANTAGIYLPAPDERDFLQEIEIEASKKSQYL